jgi:FtsH-binding integral membrane protein
MSAVEPVERGEESAARAELRLLAAFLIAYCIVKIGVASIAYVVAVASAGGVDADASRTVFWIPQILFFTLLLIATRRMRRFESHGRSSVVALSVLSLAVTALHTVANFTIGVGHDKPAVAIAMLVRLLASGDIWDVIFPIFAIVWLRRPAIRQLFEIR